MARSRDAAWLDCELDEVFRRPTRCRIAHDTVLRGPAFVDPAGSSPEDAR